MDEIPHLQLCWRAYIVAEIGDSCGGQCVKRSSNDKLGRAA